MIGKLIIGTDEAILNDDLTWSATHPSIKRYLDTAFPPEKNETAGRLGAILLANAAEDLEVQYELTPLEYTTPPDITL